MKNIKDLSILFAAFLFVLIFNNPSHAQECQGDIILSSQAEVDAFVCTEVIGDLRISGADITSLDHLISLTKIGGNLSIVDNLNLQSLDGLSALDSVGSLTIQSNNTLSDARALNSLKRSGSLNILNNPQLSDIELSALQSITSDISIIENENLNTISGFNNLFESGSIMIRNNPKLESITGFHSLNSTWYYFDDTPGSISILENESLIEIQAFPLLTQVGDMSIINNKLLSNLNGFPSLAALYGILNISNNESLVSVNGFQQLTHISTLSRSVTEVGLIIENNTSLESFTGLSSLEKIGDEYNAYASISNNPSLKNLDGLASLSSFLGWGEFGAIFEIRNNPSLDACCALRTLLKTTRVQMSGNGAGCTVEEILNCPVDPICYGDFLLSSQAEVDAFACKEVIGNLTITGSDITDLLGLSLLTKVSGNLFIASNPALKNLDGLSALDSVGRELRIQSNNTLSDISALNSLKRTGSLYVSNNPELTDIELSAIHTIQGDFGHTSAYIDGNQNLNTISGFNNLVHTGPIMISNNPKLESITGFHSLKSTRYFVDDIPGGISILGNESLINIQAFPQLTQVGNISINNNKLLPMIDGFPSLSALYGILNISNNESLKSIDGFQKLTRISTSSRSVTDIGLVIDDNASLENFTGLSSLTTIGDEYYAYFSISNNPSLKNLNGLASLTDVLGGGGDVSFEITNNATLENIDGLSSLKRVVGAVLVNIKVTQNPLLTSCCSLLPLIEYLEGSYGLNKLISDGSLQISENGGCTIDDIIACGPQKIARFNLIDLRTGGIIRSFKNNSLTVDLADPGFSNWAVQAETFPTQVGSVTFRFDNNYEIVENQLPYSYALSNHLQLASYTVTADVYSESYKKGIKGTGRTATIIPINSAAVTNFDIVDADGNTLMALNEDSKIDLEDPRFQSFSIRANVTPNIRGNVKFWLNDKFFRVENIYPYTLHGDGNVVYGPWKPGDYTIRAVPYVKIGGKEFKGEALEVHFKVISEHLNSVVSFDIVDQSGGLLSRLNEGDFIDIDDLMSKGATIVANTTGKVGSVRFYLNDQPHRIENILPYSLTGDNYGPLFNPWLPKVQNYTLKAVPYSRSYAQGEAGNSLTVNFTVVDQDKNYNANRIATTVPEGESVETDGGTGLTVYPVPVEGELFVEINDEVGNDAVFTILTVQGLNVHNGPYSRSTSISTLNLKPGLYFVKVVSKNGFSGMARFIKK